MKRFFSPSKFKSAAFLITITSFFSYAIGLLRDRIIAVNFGTTIQTDIYNASFLIPDSIFNFFIASALASAFLPVFSQYLDKDKEEAQKIANTVLNGGVMIILLFSIVSFIFMPQLIEFLFPNVSTEGQKDIILMTKLMLPSAILFAISNTLGNILMSHKHFFSYAISPILYNLGIIFGIIFLQDKFGIYAAAIGVLAGATLHCIIRIIDIFFIDYKYAIKTDFKSPGFIKIIKLMIPRSVGLIAWQLNLYIFTIVGLKLIEGGISAFNFARNIQSFAVSLFGIALSTAVFPYLASSSSEDKKGDFTNYFQTTLEKILFFTIPSAIGLMLLSTPIIELLLSGGIFQKESIKLTSLILFFFAFSIPFESITHLVSRSFYAKQNTITPTIITLASFSTIAAITYFIAPNYGIEWFSIGFSIGFILQVILLLIFIRPHLKNFNTNNFLKNLSKTILATGLMAVAILILQPLETIIPVKIAHTLRIIIPGLIFLFTAYLLKSPEIRALKQIISRN